MKEILESENKKVHVANSIKGEIWLDYKKLFLLDSITINYSIFFDKSKYERIASFFEIRYGERLHLEELKSILISLKNKKKNLIFLIRSTYGINLYHSTALSIPVK